MTAPDLSTPEAIAQARAEAVALLQGVATTRAAYEANVSDVHRREFEQHGKVIESLTPAQANYQRDMIAARCLLEGRAPTTTVTLIAALDALATTRQALARAEAERERLGRDVLEFIRLSTPNGGYDYWAAVRQRLMHVLDPEVSP